MSATNRGRTRAAHDEYATPPWPVHRLLEAVSLPSGRWLEPSAGRGAIIRAVRQVRNDVCWIACERQERHEGRLQALAPLVHDGDFLELSPGRFDVVIGNPPYDQALDFVTRALPLAPVVVFLLRLNWLASAARNALMRSHAPDVYVLPDRPSFRGGGSDSTEYAWFVWHGDARRAAGTVQVLAMTPPAERLRARSAR
jgi:hypothetical protein